MSVNRIAKKLINKVKGLKDNPRVQKWAIRTVPLTLCLTIFFSYAATIESNAVVDETGELAAAIQAVQDEDKPSILDPITEYIEDAVGKGAFTVSQVLGYMALNTFGLDIDLFTDMEAGVDPARTDIATMDYLSSDYTIKDSKILYTFWTVGCFLGMTISTLTLLVSLLAMIAGGSKQIKDNPLFLALRYIIVSFCILKSDVIIAGVLKIFNMLWVKALGLMLGASLTAGGGLFGIKSDWKFTNNFLGFANNVAGVKLAFFINGIIWPFILIKLVMTFLKVYKALVERYLIFMISLILAPVGIGCATSKMTSKTSLGYLQLIFGEFIALVFDAAALQMIILVTANGYVWLGIVPMILYFALCKIVVQMDTFMSKMGFNIINQGSQLARSIGASGMSIGRMATTALRGKREVGNIGKNIVARGIENGDPNAINAGTKLMAAAGLPTQEYRGAAGVQFADNLNNNGHHIGEENIVDTNGQSALSQREASQFLSQQVGAAGHAYGAEYAQKGIGLENGDSFIRMTGNDIQHLGKNGELKSAIVDGHVYSKDEINNMPATKRKIDDFNARQDSQLPFMQKGAVSQNTEGLNNYDFLTNQGMSKMRAQELSASLADKKIDKIASVEASDGGKLLVRDDKGFVVGGINNNGVMQKEDINSDIYAHNRDSGSNKFATPLKSWDSSTWENGDDVFSSARNYAESVGCTPQAQEQFASHCQEQFQRDGYLDSTQYRAVAVGGDGTQVSFIDSHTGSVSYYVNKEKGFTGAAASNAMNIKCTENGYAASSSEEFKTRMVNKLRPNEKSNQGRSSKRKGA